MWDDKIKTDRVLPYPYGWDKYDTETGHQDYPNRVYKNTKPPNINAMLVLDETFNQDFTTSYFDQ